MITSTTNRTIRSVRRFGKRPWRDSQGRLLCEGHAVVRAALEASAPIHLLLHTPAALRNRADLLRRVTGTGAEVIAVSEEVMAWLCPHPSPPDVLTLVTTPAHALDSLATEPAALLLTGVTDPSQAGGILALGATLGVGSAATAPGSVDPFDPKAIRAGRGAQFRLPTARDLPAEQVVAHHRARGARVVAIGPNGEPPWAVDMSGPILFVTADDGSIGPDRTVTLPAKTSIAVGSSMLLYEWWRQRSV